MKRHHTKEVWVGAVPVGNFHPISIQSMTNTKTQDVAATVQQIQALEKAGCDIVRLAVPDMQAAQAIASIKKQVNIPMIADIHFDYRLALASIENGIDGLRLNPGNIGDDQRVCEVIKAAGHRNLPIRIGVNAGSLEPELLKSAGGHPTAEAMVESALYHVRLLESQKYFYIKISLKAADVPMTLQAYQMLAEKVSYPLHIGITESGTVRSGTIKSAVGIGALLAMGIGDTLRVSLTGDPVNEIKVGKEILKVLGLRNQGPVLVSCPTCGRCGIDLESIALQVEDRLASIEQPIKVAVMGCLVNGPGEAKEADIGIAGGDGQGLIFRKGAIIRKVSEKELVSGLMDEIDRLLAEE